MGSGGEKDRWGKALVGGNLALAWSRRGLGRFADGVPTAPVGQEWGGWGGDTDAGEMLSWQVRDACNNPIGWGREASLK